MTQPGPRKPKTPYVKQRCHRCRGSGRAPCPICQGTGRVFKGKDRLGTPLYDRCDGCLGARTRVCSHCSGEGFA